MHTEGFINHITALRSLGGSRVWSLMISLFGDLAQADGQHIEGPQLSTIMGLLQVKPEATRVALHRLRNDGWITSSKSGRISAHALTVKGRMESAAASPRIYAEPQDAAQSWQLIILEDVLSDELEGFAPIGPRIYVGDAELAAPEGALTLPGTAVPDWLRLQAEPEHLRQDYVALQETLAALSDALPDASEIAPIETAVLRCLIVHNWRRLVLKHPALPAPLVSDDWPGRHCHVLVANLLARFPRPSLAGMDQRRAA